MRVDVPRPLWHVAVLTKRNFVHAKRRWKGTVGQIFAPVLICLLLLAFQGISDWVLSRDDPDPPATLVGNVPRCEDSSSCVSILYAPGGVPWVDSAMKTVAAQQGLDWGTDVRAFSSGSLQRSSSSPPAVAAENVGGKGNFTDDYAALLLHFVARPNTTRIACVFHGAYENAVHPGRGYILFYNGTVSVPESAAAGAKAAIDAALLAEELGSEVSLTSALGPFPSPPPRASQYDVVAANGALWFYCAPLITFFLFLTEIVAEKERGQRVGMRRFGLSDSGYFVSWYLQAACFVTLNTLALVAAGTACRFPVFIHTNPVVLFLAFELFGLSMAAVALFMSTLIRKQVAAQTVAYTVILVGFVFVTILSSQYGALVDLLYSSTIKPWVKVIKWIFTLLPPFSLSKLYYDISTKSGNTFDRSTATVKIGKGFGWHDLSESRSLKFFGEQITVPPPYESLITMLVDTFIYLLLTAYLDAVLGEHGTARHPLFFLSPSFWCGRAGSARGDAGVGVVGRDGGETMAVAAPEIAHACDDEVREEHGRAQRADPGEDLIVAVGLGKTYPSSRSWWRRCIPSFSSASSASSASDGSGSGDGAVRALQGLSLRAGARAARDGPGEVICLLGHNGAGKTTTINLLTGLFPPSEGRGWVCGRPLEDSDAVRSVIAVCPQADTLFPDLTAREHVVLYTQLRVPDLRGDALQAEVDRTLRSVGLFSRADGCTVSTFSGGMCRRLSVAIATVGDPRVVFLDEPTTGLDPITKRSVVSLLHRLKKGRLLVMSTQILAEAELLADRIALLAGGALRCIGSPLAIKARYAPGVAVTISTRGKGGRSGSGRASTGGEGSSAAMDEVQRRVTELIPGALRDLGGVSSIASGSDAGASSGRKLPSQSPTGPSNSSARGTFVVPPDDIAAMPKLVRWLEDEADSESGIVQQWSVGSRTLDEAFRKVNDIHGFGYDDAAEEDMGNVGGGGGGGGSDPAYAPLETGEKDKGKDMGTGGGGGGGGGDIRDTDECDDAPRSFAFRALFRKNLHIQKRQKVSNVCQVITPVFVTMILFILQMIIKSELGDDYREEVLVPSVPIALNTANLTLPGGLARLLESQGIDASMFNGTVPREDCLSFYWIGHSPDVDAGHLYGNGSSGGLLGHLAPLQYACHVANETVPPLHVTGGAPGTGPGGGPFAWESNPPPNHHRNDNHRHQHHHQKDGAPADKRRVPYFVPVGAPGDGEPRWSPDSAGDEDVLRGLFNILTFFNGENIKHVKHRPLNAALPDAAVVVNALSLDGGGGDSVGAAAARPAMALDVTLRVNDVHFSQYHRKNDITRIGFKIANVSEDIVSHGDKMITGGVVSTMDLVHRAFAAAAREKVRAASGVARGGTAVGASRAFVNPGDINYAQMFPYRKYADLLDALEAFGVFLYPVALCMLLPVFVFILVMEKEDGLREIQRAHGLRAWPYFMSIFCHNLTMYTFTVAFFWISGKAISLRFFNTNVGVLVAFFAGWGLSVQAIAFFIASMVNRRQTAVVVGWVVALGGSFLCILFSAGIYGPLQIAVSSVMPAGYFVWPQFALARAVYLLNYSCAADYACRASLGSFASDELTRAIVYLYADAAVYALLGLYLDAIVPRKHGTVKHPLFPLRALVASLRGASSRLAGRSGRTGLLYESLGKTPVDADPRAVPLLGSGSGPTGPRSSAPPRPPRASLNSDGPAAADAAADAAAAAASVEVGAGGTGSSEHGLMDDDCIAEAVRVREIVACGEHIHGGHPVVADELRKVYPGADVPAVRSLSLAASRGDITCLLGENGAGKTTTVSMLTGMKTASSGDAWVGGFSVRDEVDDVHLVTGLVPQFNLLWDDLSCEDHLFFYARLKGVPASKESAAVARALTQVGLLDVKKRLAKNLSGGMKRRLTIANALIGRTQVVFLDEPSTGLDPSSVRQLWNIISRAQIGRSIVLLTHSMEEATQLATRVAIMGRGDILAVGTVPHLCAKYGNGFRVSVTFAEGNGGAAHECVTAALPGAALVIEHVRSRSYEIRGTVLKVSEVFERMLAAEQSPAIEEWGVSMASLDDVFANLIEPFAAINEAKVDA